jgi:hippurate hydrolase
MAASLSQIQRLCPPELQEKLVALRHELHSHPELSFQETETAERLYRSLAELDLERLERIGETGLIAKIRGRDPKAPTVALRGDIDALPIQEQTGAAFASTRPGVMHACGHDVHAAWTVGAAHLLAKNPAAGDLVILLQPGEETGRGAPALIEAGALEGVAAIFAAHVDLRFEIGQVVAQPGTVGASADEFTISVTGRGSHGGRPHEGADPIVGAAALIGALQPIVARRVAPGVPAVVSVGAIAGGSAPNVIPETVKLSGTLRAADRSTRELLRRELQRVCHGVSEAHGIAAALEIKPGTPPLINEARATELARGSVRALLGDDALRELPVPNMGGEDFAFYLERVPGCFLRIGARAPGEQVVPAHTAGFLPADDAVCVGAAVLAVLARRASEAWGRPRGSWEPGAGSRPDLAT